jgi:hypothetical protein
MSEQLRRHSDPAGSHARSWRRQDRFFESLRHLRQCRGVLPIRAETPQQPINPYGASKAMAERMLFGAAHALKATVLRYFNAAGADPENEIGEPHDPGTHLIPLLLDAASDRRKNVTSVRNRLLDSRWDMRSRLHPRIRLGRGPRQSSVRSWSAIAPRFTISAMAVDSRLRKLLTRLNGRHDRAGRDW